VSLLKILFKPANSGNKKPTTKSQRWMPSQDDINRYIASKGVTKLPPAIVGETTAKLNPEDEKIIKSHNREMFNWNRSLARNESPFSREWQTYKINGFEGEPLFIRDAITLDDALVRMNPKCPECDVVNKISYIRSA